MMKLVVLFFSLVLGAASLAGALETSRWQAAIDAAAARGGGRVSVPAGRHLVGQLELRSNVELHLEKGAVLEGVSDRTAYRIVRLPFSEGTWSAVVAGFSVTNVAITGLGQIFGNGCAWNPPEGARDELGCTEGLRPRGVLFADSKDIRLSDFMLRDSACWGVVFKRCEEVSALRVKIDSCVNLNNDGFDVEAKDVLIEDCDVNSGDDAYCIKSNDPTFVVENVRIRNCVGRSHCNGLKLGTASHGVMRNIRFENCRLAAPTRVYRDLAPMPSDLSKPNRVIGAPDYLTGAGIGAICVECVDGGTVEDVIFDGIEANGFKVPIFVRGGRRMRRDCGILPSNTCVLRNVTIANIRGRAESALASSVTGVSQCRPQYVRLRNIHIVCHGEGPVNRPFSLPGPETTGSYPEATMFSRYRLPYFGLFVDQADDVILENAEFVLAEGERDSRLAYDRERLVRPVSEKPDFAAHVDPFIGTAATGHTFPAACVPFGLVQAGPDTGNGDWNHCSGYHHEDRTVCGFSQTHLNGTGCPDLGDLRLMPLKEGAEDMEEIACEQTDEVAEPGYYAVSLKNAARVEIAASHHAAIYRFVYSRPGIRRLLVDCAYGTTGGRPAKEITRSAVLLDGKFGLSGVNHRKCWVERDYAFVVAFDRPCITAKELPKTGGRIAPQYIFEFELKEGEPLSVKVALSAEGEVTDAKRNLVAEIPEWDFSSVRLKAHKEWNAILGRAVVSGTDAQKKNWYTALYRLFIQPNNIADVGVKPFFSTFSCWDTFRAAHPLYTVLAADRVSDMVDSMLEQGRRTGFLPIWTLWGMENQCMVGTHSVPVIVDAFLKGIWKGDAEAAYARIRETLTAPHVNRRKENWDVYDRYGYYPFDKIRSESVSRTLECAYDDWCAAQMSRKLGHEKDSAFFMKRAANWKNVFDPSVGMVRGKDSSGNWREPYDPFALGHGANRINDFTEGNAFQYTWHVMQDPHGLVAAMGGHEKFVKRLDSLFVQTTDAKIDVSDITGLIGQYVHGNEPSHHVIYFYPQVGHPEKAADRIREVFDRFYRPKPDGLCGNDDCGQMSAWYLFSAMGFYPFNPCGGEYIVGAPQVSKVTISLPGEKTFMVVAQNLSKKNKYVGSVLLNGQPLSGFRIRHEQIMAGGTLVFDMVENPQRK